ncbi:MAG: carboxypeptidase regulatory-like domain-containing protein, partial [Acidobacteria bacterium]|nr:carboxypeptidase regulatory-like domain-containing protein [Acidobacteriota bacterium]
MSKVVLQYGRSRWFRICTLALLTLTFVIGALGQVTTGSVQGVVRDPNDAVISGATVHVTNVDTGITTDATTNNEGFYSVTNLTPGQNYRVAVNASGFAAATVQNVAVRLGVNQSVDVKLSLAGSTTTVTVTADDSSLIQNTQNQLSQSYSPRQIQELPYNGGSIDNLALLTPGVVTPGDADFTNGVGISANGNRGRSNNFQLDGQDNNDNSVAGPTLTLTNTEAVGDYQVITNNPSAEFGRNAGAQVNVVTRSGTNDFHGSLFEYFQNNRLNARNNTQKQAAATYRFLANNGFPALTGLANRNGQDIFSYHRFGGALGGPIKKNKAFFFATFQQDHQNGETDTNNFGSGGFTFTPGSINAAVAAGFPGAQ